MMNERRVELLPGIEVKECYLEEKKTGVVFRGWADEDGSKCEHVRELPRDVRPIMHDSEYWYYVRRADVVLTGSVRLKMQRHFQDEPVPFQFWNKRVALTTGAPPVPNPFGKRRGGGRRSS